MEQCPVPTERPLTNKVSTEVRLSWISAMKRTLRSERNSPSRVRAEPPMRWCSGDLQFSCHRVMDKLYD
ncbi:hypothetical protein PoB_003639400 [Plakobranchus ocellatus]|uniref:Uncharacterized protein n=1 Tax=Plakobranchus ocellatus TaxID=259542 RepID=A0AAV4AQ23_9GAST|nr:hypothetical protein PoB_003639400 [Plakobranchus ocellatus]